MVRNDKTSLKTLAVSIGANFISRSEGRRLQEVKLVDFGNASQHRHYSHPKPQSSEAEAIKDTIDRKIADLKDDLAGRKQSYLSVKRFKTVSHDLASGIAIIRVGGLNRRSR